MPPSSTSVGVNIGQAALASSTAVDLSVQYAGLDTAWKSAVVDAAATAGQPLVSAAVQTFGEQHTATIAALMAHTGAVAGGLNSSLSSSVDVDQLNSATLGEALGALSLTLSGPR